MIGLYCRTCGVHIKGEDVISPAQMIVSANAQAAKIDLDEVRAAVEAGDPVTPGMLILLDRARRTIQAISRPRWYVMPAWPDDAQDGDVITRGAVYRDGRRIG